MTHENFSLAVRQLHSYLLRMHWDGRALVGPDCGIRFNARIGRFAKSYLSFINWSDNLIYFQAQAYWIKSNWILNEVLGDQRYKRLALDCSRFVLARQQEEGYWPYPNPEWKGRIATVEGCYGALGLLETYCHSRQGKLLAGAMKWHKFLIKHVGFQKSNELLAVNYFAHRNGALVPNNSTLVLKLLAKLRAVTGENRFLKPCAGLVAWLRQVQMTTGELPYSVGANGKGRSHFLCYQYNAFEFLDLLDYYDITHDPNVWSVLRKLAGFLASGVDESGTAMYGCGQMRPEVLYYAAAVAAALSQAEAAGLVELRGLAERTYRWVLSQQRPDGGFAFFSRHNYGFLEDRRSYPRNLAMVLAHLLLEWKQRLGYGRSAAETPLLV